MTQTAYHTPTDHDDVATLNVALQAARAAAESGLYGEETSESLARRSFDLETRIARASSTCPSDDIIKLRVALDLIDEEPWEDLDADEQKIREAIRTVLDRLTAS